MNNTFNINRFGNVVRRDGMSYFQNFGWTLIVLWALPVIMWFLTYISMETFDTGVISNRDTKISILMWLQEFIERVSSRNIDCFMIMRISASMMKMC